MAVKILGQPRWLYLLFFVVGGLGSLWGFPSVLNTVVMTLVGSALLLLWGRRTQVGWGAALFCTALFVIPLVGVHVFIETAMAFLFR